MPKTLNQGFEELLTQLTPTSGESLAAQNHRTSIFASLSSSFGLNRFFRTGSFGNGTSISGYSDVDYFACLNVPAPANSFALLSSVQQVLSSRLPNTGVVIDCPAVLAPFGDDAKEATEIVPAYFVQKSQFGTDVFQIPNCSGGWMLSSPDTHNSYVRQVDDMFGGKVKPLIRFAKAWKFYKQAGISSFYMELRVALFAQRQQYIEYDEDLATFLSELHASGLAAVWDPMGVSGYISAGSDATALAVAFLKLQAAATWAGQALSARRQGDVQQAFRLWDNVFNGHFPSYY